MESVYQNFLFAQMAGELRQLRQDIRNLRGGSTADGMGEKKEE